MKFLKNIFYNKYWLKSLIVRLDFINFRLNEIESYIRGIKSLTINNKEDLESRKEGFRKIDIPVNNNEMIERIEDLLDVIGFKLDAIHSNDIKDSNIKKEDSHQLYYAAQKMVERLRNDISKGEPLHPHNIDNKEDFDKSSLRAKDWFDSLSKNNKRKMLSTILGSNTEISENIPKGRGYITSGGPHFDNQSAVEAALGEIGENLHQSGVGAALRKMREMGENPATIGARAKEAENTTTIKNISIGRHLGSPVGGHLPPLKYKHMTRDTITCLICSKKLSTLKRHLSETHKINPKTYIKQFQLPKDYPMVSINTMRRIKEGIKRSWDQRNK